VDSIAVVICTRNRARKLPALFDSLAAAADAALGACEFVVVDNGSTDDTRATVESFAARSPAPCRYVSEARTGKSRALNTGVRSTGSPLLAFTDDDIVVAPDWLLRIRSEFLSDPGLDGLGGRVELRDPACLPIATRTSRERLALTREAFTLDNPQIIGCNMALRRGPLERAGGFDENLGPGSPGVSGEEVDLLYRLLFGGARIAYVPEILVFHDHERRPGDDHSALFEAYVRGRGAFYWKHGIAGDRCVLRAAYREVRRTMRAPRTAWRHLSALSAGAAAYAVRGRSAGR